jgi:hypothetical protein
MPNVNFAKGTWTSADHRLAIPCNEHPHRHRVQEWQPQDTIIGEVSKAKIRTLIRNICNFTGDPMRS